MFIRSIEDTKLLQREISNKKQHIVYVFYKGDICMYVGKTNSNKQFNYIMNHHTIKKIRSKFKDGYYIKIYFEKDIPYIDYTLYEGMLIGLLNPKLNRKEECGRILTVSAKYDIPFLEYIKKKKIDNVDKVDKYTYEPTITHLDVFKLYVNNKCENIYDDIFDRHNENFESIYEILKVCRFKNIYDAYKLIKKYRSTLSKNKFVHYTARKDKVYKNILHKLCDKEYINIDLYNKILKKQYCPMGRYWEFCERYKEEYYKFNPNKTVDFREFGYIDDHYVY